MKSERRHELKENALASEFGKMRSFFDRYGNYVLLVAGAAVLIFVVTWVWHGRSQRARAEENALFENAQMSVLEKGPGAKPALADLANLAENAHVKALGAKAAVLSGDVYLQVYIEAVAKGQEEQAADARKSVEQYYRLALDKYKGQTLQAAQAHYGLGVMHETAGQRDEALKEYKVAAELGGKNYQIGKMAAEAGKALESQSQPARLATTTSAPGGAIVFRPTTSTAPASMPASGPAGLPAAATAPAGEPATASAPASRAAATQP